MTMAFSCIGYFVFVHSACAACEGDAKGYKVPSSEELFLAPLSSDALFLVQLHGAKAVVQVVSERAVAMMDGSPSGTQFQYGSNCSDVCPSGYTFIEDGAECATAATSLGLGLNEEIYEHGDARLPYCWLGSAGKANFNPYADSGSNCTSHASKLICEKIPEYEYGSNCSDVCPSGYTFIEDGAECAIAATSLGLGLNEEIYQHGDARLPYCWLGSAGKANFNPDADSGSDCMSNPSSLICKMVNGR